MESLGSQHEVVLQTYFNMMFVLLFVFFGASRQVMLTQTRKNPIQRTLMLQCHKNIHSYNTGADGVQDFHKRQDGDQPNYL